MMTNSRSTEVNDMNCFTCKRECVMRTEKHMNDTPCSVCERGVHVADEWCRDCLAYDDRCNFTEKEEEA